VVRGKFFYPACLLRSRGETAKIEAKEFFMPTICPVSDLKTKLDEITDSLRLSREPVFLTENGYGRFVLVDIDDWEDKAALEDLQNDPVLLAKLRKSAEAALSPDTKWLTHEEVFGRLKEKYPAPVLKAKNA
jgi:PHD/YefM family antitoxin component YafN of YafNO toxin-antitoxin module